MSIVIAAAGTGGHVFPAIAVAEALVDAGTGRDQIVFFGGDRIEARVVPEAGFEFAGYPLARLERSLTLRNLRIPWTVARTSRSMGDALARVGASAVLGMGGYVSVPAARAARRARIPFLLQEQNATPGLASRYAARGAHRVFVGLPGRSERLPSAELVGNPLRSGFDGFDRKALRPAAAAAYGLDDAGPIVGLLGGSLGARVLDEAAPAIAAALPLGSTLLHLTGSAAEPASADGRAPGGAAWRRVPFEDRMERFYAAVDLVVGRAGAMTVTELAATGTPSVLVPLARGGQRANAAALGSVGATAIVRQRDIGLVGDIVARMISDPPKLLDMAAAARRVARPGAARVIADALSRSLDV